MSQLAKNIEMVDGLIDYLQQQKDSGHSWVVYDTDNPINSKYNLHCFGDESEALSFAKSNQQIWNWHEAVSISTMIYKLKELDKIQSDKTDLNNNRKSIKKGKAMNLNNLENLKEEMKNLGFRDKLIEKMEENMTKNVPEFTLYDNVLATKGQVDLTLHFKQSGQSDFYYFNKFTVSHNQGKPLEEGQQYMVLTKNEEGKNIVKKLENVSDALAFFKEQKGNSELAVGKDAASKVMLASMENGKVNYIAKEFNRTFYASPVNQTIWLERGKGFTAEQAANLIQGRSVYRDDMMNMGGETYKAWIKLDFDKGKDRFQNYSINQYHDPSYGFDINKVLDKFNIKELQDPAKRVLLETSLRNGNRPLVTVEKEGQEVKVFLEAVPRYSQLNMYAENGRPEKREQFWKNTALSSTQENTKGKEKEMSESQGVRR